VFPPRQRPGSFSVEQALEKLRLPPATIRGNWLCCFRLLGQVFVPKSHSAIGGVLAM
jgi:hypothetical protein